jgi:hypothetical protein
MGTYRNPGVCLENVKSRKDEPELPTAKDVLAMIEMMLGDSSVTIEQAVETIFTERYGGSPDAQGKLFRRWMNHSYLAELYVRNRVREQAVKALADAGLPVKIIGDWWEKAPFTGAQNVQRMESVDFAKSYRRIAECKVLLNSSPFFYGGMHDRIPAGMANHTLVLTDANPYLERTFADTLCMQMYSMRDFPADLTARAREALTDEQGSRERAECAFELYKMRFTWLHISEKVLNYIKDMQK